MVDRNCPLPPPGGDRVKVSENLGATLVALVAPGDTSLHKYIIFKTHFIEKKEMDFNKGLKKYKQQIMMAQVWRVFSKVFQYFIAMMIWVQW